MSSPKLKVVVVESYPSGKTSLINMLLYDNFQNVKYTQGVPNIDYKEITSSNGKKVMLEIWDIDSHDYYLSVNRIYYKNAKIVLIIYDITNLETFRNAQTVWFPEVKCSW